MSRPEREGPIVLRTRVRREAARATLVALRADPDGGRLSQEGAAQLLGCGERLIWELEQEPDFWRAVHDAVIDLERRHLGTVYRALREKALSGDLGAMKLYLSQAGVLQADRLELVRSLDVTATVEWRELRATVLGAVDHHPEAREAIARALQVGLEP